MSDNPTPPPAPAPEAPTPTAPATPSTTPSNPPIEKREHPPSPTPAEFVVLEMALKVVVVVEDG
ncbi:hypothetical protein GYMLUDRAFT_250601 [Collybiopsis luxurians FD-317 M1]|uniref:Uncharacterized protein n=1 Tax=Collybiopsis luxurians FD-317 M1 TaxID=944289 RepID=A0A0D0BU92_9AGAR|nr:hypothetical protein GYMLUDRAFT_250601 [Collybiopsis luxurians FD-317 M1]